MKPPDHIIEIKKAIRRVWRGGRAGIQFLPPCDCGDIACQRQYWVVLVYPPPREIVGGENDGTIIFSGFSVELLKIYDILDTVESMEANSGCGDKLEPMVRIVGTHQRNKVGIGILYQPIHGAKIKETVDADTGEVKPKPRGKIQ